MTQVTVTGFIRIIYFCLVLQKTKWEPKPLLRRQNCVASRAFHNLLPGLHLYCRGLGWSVIYTCKWTHFMNISSKKFLSLLYSIIHKIGQRRSLIYNPFSQIYVSVPKKALLLEEHWFLMTQIACLYLGWENWPCQIYILCPGWWFTSAKCQTN